MICSFKKTSSSISKRKCTRRQILVISTVKIPPVRRNLLILSRVRSAMLSLPLISLIVLPRKRRPRSTANVRSRSS